MPESTSLTAYIGTTKEITLRISGRIEEPLKIIVRKKPRIGTLGEPFHTDRNKIVFTYTSPAEARAGSDFFTYAVQSVDSPVSVKARVDILLMERPAALRAVNHLDFESVDVGEKAEKALLIENTGGATAFLKPLVNSPWHLRDAGTLSIPGGSRMEVGISFTPQTAGSFSDRLILNETTSVTLQGEAAVPLDWPVQGILFDAAARKSGSTPLLVSNRSTTPRTIHFQWPEYFNAPEKVSVEAGGQIQVPIQLTASPTFSKKGSVKATSGGFQAEIPFVVLPAAAQVILSPQQQIAFGDVERGTELTASIELTNRGGLPIRLSLGMPKQIKTKPSLGTFDLAPGETKGFAVVWTPLESGQHLEKIEVRAPHGVIGEFHLAASVRAAKPVEKLLSLKPAPQSANEINKPEVAEIPPVQECFLAESTPHSVTISWKLTSPDTKDFLVERRVIRSGPEGRVIEHWEPWRQVDIQIAGDTATAHFRKLAPGTFWNIRLRGIDSKGLAGPPTPGHFRIETQPINRWKIPFWLWMPIAVLLAGGIFLFLKKRVRFQIGENLDQRIARLEK